MTEGTREDVLVNLLLKFSTNSGAIEEIEKLASNGVLDDEELEIGYGKLK